MVLCSGGGALAAEGKYYMVDGRVYADGSAEIARVDVAEGVFVVQTLEPGEYALAGLNADYYGISLTPLAVSFEPAADAGGGRSEYAEFFGLIPYDEEIVAFAVVNGEADVLAIADIAVESAQSEIAWFDVAETDGGYDLVWEVLLADDGGADRLEYDVMAVSQDSGESNMLAYRTRETSLFVPFDWLEPNDTVVFTLRSNDSRTTLSASSEIFFTPDGKAKIVSDDEEWLDPEPGGAPTLYMALGAAVLILAAAAAVFVIRRGKARKEA
jgi:hypothetical protein